MNKRFLVDITLRPFFIKGIKIWGSSLITITTNTNRISVGIGYYSKSKKDPKQPSLYSL